MFVGGREKAEGAVRGFRGVLWELDSQRGKVISREMTQELATSDAQV